MEQKIHEGGEINMAKTYTGYCVRCRQVREMKKAVIVELKSGMNAAKGQCIKCKCNMCKIIGKAKK